MHSNNEMPVGLAMELAKNSKAMEQFSSLSKSEQDAVIEQACHISSREEMRHYVSTLAVFDHYS